MEISLFRIQLPTFVPVVLLFPLPAAPSQGFIFTKQNCSHPSRSGFKAKAFQEASPDFSYQCHFSHLWASHSIFCEHLLLNFMSQKVCTEIVPSLEFKLACDLVQSRLSNMCEMGKDATTSLGHNQGHFFWVNLYQVHPPHQDKPSDRTASKAWLNLGNRSPSSYFFLFFLACWV